MSNLFQMATVTLKPVGDAELWLLESGTETPEERAWCLPMFVEWKQSDDGALYGLVTPGVSLYHTQMVLTKGAFGSHNLIPAVVGRWLVRKVVVSATMRKAEGIHPEFYYKWPDDELPPIPKPYYPVSFDNSPTTPPPRRMEKFRAFAEFVGRERHLPTDVVLVVLTAIAQLGTEWLVKHRQPLDLGFVRLLALPFRMNWKEVISFKCRPWKLAAVLKLGKATRDETLRQMRFEATACSVHNIGLRNMGGTSRRLEYTVEAIPSSSFDTQVDEIEEERMSAGTSSYVAEYESAVQHHYDAIVDAMSYYTKKVAAAWAHVRSLGGSGVLAFLPAGRKLSKVRGVPINRIPTHIVPPADNFSVFAEREEGDQHLIQAQDDEMHKVPAVPPAADDVRECEVIGDVDQPRPEGTNGVPMLYVGQSAPPGEPVFSVYTPDNTGSSGVDG